MPRGNTARIKDIARRKYVARRMMPQGQSMLRGKSHSYKIRSSKGDDEI